MRAFVRSVSLLCSIVAATIGGSAFADEPSDATPASWDCPVAAPTNAFELTIGGGYTQGAGDISERGSNIHDVSHAGAQVEMKAAYRIIPSLAIGAYGTYAQFVRGDVLADGTDVRSVTAGFFADYHFRPDRSLDPYVGLASGWRGFWLYPNQGKNTSLQGWEIARLQVGLDYRISHVTAIGPVIGASVNTFFTESTPDTNGFDNVHNPRASFFFFSGIQGRFDFGGSVPTGQGQAQQAQARN